jgi:hypothetical protein
MQCKQAFSYFNQEEADGNSKKNCQVTINYRLVTLYFSRKRCKCSFKLYTSIPLLKAARTTTRRWSQVVLASVLCNHDPGKCQAMLTHRHLMYVLTETKLTSIRSNRIWLWGATPWWSMRSTSLIIYIYIYIIYNKWPRPSGRLPPMASHEIVAAREWIDACSAPARKREKLWEQKTSKAHVII